MASAGQDSRPWGAAFVGGLLLGSSLAAGAVYLATKYGPQLSDSPGANGSVSRRRRNTAGRWVWDGEGGRAGTGLASTQRWGACLMEPRDLNRAGMQAL